MRARLLAVPACLLLGLLTAVAAVLVHGAGWGWLLLALGAPLAVAVALPPGGRRLAHAAPFTVVSWASSIQRPEGDYLVQATPGGYGFLFGALALLGFAVLTMPRMKR